MMIVFSEEWVRFEFRRLCREVKAERVGARRKPASREIPRGVCRDCGDVVGGRSYVCTKCRKRMKAEYGRRWREMNPDRSTVDSRKWKKKNPERYKKQNDESRARMIVKKRALRAAGVGPTEAEREKGRQAWHRARAREMETPEYKAKAAARLNRQLLAKTKKSCFRAHRRFRALLREKTKPARDAAAKARGTKRARENWRRDYRNNPAYRIQCIMRSRINKTMRYRPFGIRGRKRFKEIFGYSPDDLEARLRSTVPDGSCWQDFMEGKLHIDHIRPISSFDIDTEDHPDFRVCWGLDNLQLLTASDNLKKHATWDGYF